MSHPLKTLVARFKETQQQQPTKGNASSAIKECIPKKTGFHNTLEAWGQAIQRHHRRLRVYMQRSGTGSSHIAKQATERLAPHTLTFKLPAYVVDTLSRQALTLNACEPFISPQQNWIVLSFRDKTCLRYHVTSHTISSPTYFGRLCDVTNDGMLVTKVGEIDVDCYRRGECLVTSHRTTCVQLIGQPDVVYEFPDDKAWCKHTYTHGERKDEQEGERLHEHVHQTMHAASPRLVRYVDWLTSGGLEYYTHGARVWTIPSRHLDDCVVFASGKLLLFYNRTRGFYFIDQHSRDVRSPFNLVLKPVGAACQENSVWMSMRNTLYRVAIFDAIVYEAIKLQA